MSYADIRTLNVEQMKELLFDSEPDLDNLTGVTIALLDRVAFLEKRVEELGKALQRLDYTVVAIRDRDRDRDRDGKGASS